MTKLQNFLEVKPEIAKAVAEGKPVVALESTIISHGMPFPKNIEMAEEVEQIIRDNGAIPATIAIMNGKMKVGLSKEELHHLATCGNAVKTSRRDLATVLALGKTGATTVATTMIVAALAGIKVFVTGGIGGVHRGAETSFDISADLQELAHTSVAVVCAGVKSILDIGLTREYLETMGVPVVGVGNEDFPAFYTRRSGYKVDTTFANTKELASMLDAKWGLGLNGGIVVANPIPEEFAMDEEVINTAIANALKEADELGVKGKDITPFLLDKICGITSGKSLEANIKLVYNNARLGASLAVEYSKM